MRYVFSHILFNKHMLILLLVSNGGLFGESKMYKKILIFLFLLSSISVFSNDREIVFNQYGITAEKSVDFMSDEVNCAIFVDFEDIYLGIYDADEFFIWAENGLIFDPDAQNLIRVGNNPPYKLIKHNKHEALLLDSNLESLNVIKSLLQGQEVKLRYYSWPGHTKHDVILKNNFLNYAYGKVYQDFQWEDAKVPYTLRRPNIIVETFSIFDTEYTTVYPEGNMDLFLATDDNGIYLWEGIHKFLGYVENQFMCINNYPEGADSLVIRSEAGDIVFQEKIPLSLNGDKRNWESQPWDKANQAAKAAWNNCPFGTIEVTGSLRGRAASLYGFKEIWTWGVENAGLPTLD